MEKSNNETIQGPGVMAKYKTAGQIAQKVMKEIIEECKPGKDINELC